MSNQVMTVKGVKKAFESGKDKLTVLNDINLEVRKGELLMIVGPSGCGKSTLLSIMGGLSRPLSGKVLLEETDMYQMTDNELANFRNRKMGFIFQFHHLLNEFTALENVMMPALIAGAPKKQAEERAKKLLISLGLGGRLIHKPSQLSGGEQQRAAIARALVNEPDIVFADEPTGNLDRQNAEIIHRVILDFNRSYKQTFVIVTHNEHLTSFGHRVVTIEDGSIKQIKNA